MGNSMYGRCMSKQWCTCAKKYMILIVSFVRIKIDTVI